MKPQIICIISDNNDLKELILQYVKEQDLPLTEEHILLFPTASTFKSHYSGLSGILIIDSEKEIDSALAICHDEQFDMKMVVLSEKENAGDLFSQSMDYQLLKKPIQINTLFEKITLLVQELSKENAFVNIGEYQFNFKRAILRRGKANYQLTEKEAGLIMALYENYPEPLPKKALLKKVWGYDITMDTHTLETHIYRLRQKIDNDNKFLQTKTKGYVLGYMN